MSNRKGMVYSEIREEIDEIISQREKKELDAFFNKHTNEKKANTPKKDIAKYKKSDLIFVFFYFLIYFILLVSFLIITPINLDANLKEIVLWDKFVWILIYAIVVPIIYLVIRNKYQKKNS